MVVARQQQQQRQGQGDVGALGNILLRQLPLQQRTMTPCDDVNHCYPELQPSQPPVHWHQSYP